MRQVVRFAVAFALITSTAAVADAQNTLQMAAGCAPRAVTAPPPVDALRLIGAQDTVGRELFGAGDLVVIGGGPGARRGARAAVFRATTGRRAQP